MKDITFKNRTFTDLKKSYGKLLTRYSIVKFPRMINSYSLISGTFQVK